MIKKTLILILGVFVSYFTQAQTWNQIGEDINGEAAGDWSGQSISLSADGSVVAIGASYNDGNGSNAGHVRIYQNINGFWTQFGADIDGEAENDLSGVSVSLSSNGTTIAIGAWTNDGNSIDEGHARIYQYNGGNWVQIGNDIDGEASYDESGVSVCLSSDGSIIAIGALGNSANGIYAGHVRIFQNIAGTWTQIGEDIDGEAIGDMCGKSISLSSDGSIVAIGSNGNDENGENSGLVKIYQNNNGTWLQIGEDINGEAAWDNSGVSVSLTSDGSIVAIGASGNDGNGENSGHVRIFKNINGDWTQLGNDIDGETSQDFSGTDLCLNYDGSIVAIGAFLNDGTGTDAGHIRIYQFNSGTWTQLGSDIDGETEEDRFGNSIDLSADGSILAAGAYFNDGNGTDAGHVRVFESPLVEITDISKSGILIYPNPSNKFVNINFPKVYKNCMIQIYNISGKTIFEKFILHKNEIIDISGFESGIYIISIQTDNVLLTSKIIKR